MHIQLLVRGTPAPIQPNRHLHTRTDAHARLHIHHTAQHVPEGYGEGHTHTYAYGRLTQILDFSGISGWFPFFFGELLPG